MELGATYEEFFNSFRGFLIHALVGRVPVKLHRYIRIGRIAAGVITVVYTDRRENIRRIISVRKATRKEQEAYYEQ